MRNYKFYLFLFVFTIFIVTMSFAVLYIPDDTPKERYDVGTLRVMEFGTKAEWKSFPLYSYRPIQINLQELTYARIELILPYQEAHNRTTVVFYIAGAR